MASKQPGAETAALKGSVQRRTNHPYDTYFTRRVSIVITSALVRLGARANQVSVAGILVGLSSCALLAFGQGIGAVAAGAVLTHFYAVLDSVDGELARSRKEFTLRGLFLEDLSAFYVMAAFPIAIGWRAFAADLGSLLLVLALAYGAFGRNAIAAARRGIMKSIQTHRPSTPVRHARSLVEPRLRSAIDGHILNQTNVRAAVSTVLVIEVALGRQPLITSVVMTAATIGFLLREAGVIASLLRPGALEAMLTQIYDDARQQDALGSEDGQKLARYE